MKADADVIVIGGGLAGSSAALHLSRAGAKVVLLEREKAGHDKVCGEFLSGETVSLLEDLGTDIHALGAAPIRHLRMNAGQTRLVHELPAVGFGLSRRKLDARILELAARSGVDVRQGVRALEMIPTDTEKKHTIRTDQGCLKANCIFLATGKHELRNAKRRQGRDTSLVGFKLHWMLSPPNRQLLRKQVELFVFAGGYGGLSEVEEGRANLCFVIQKQLVRDMRGNWERVLAYVRSQSERLDSYLEGAEPLFSSPATVASLPYGHVGHPRQSGVYTIGDQLAVIPSLTGAGMLIALHSGREAARAFILRGAGGAEEFGENIRPALERSVRTGYLLHLLFRSPFCTAGALRLANAMPSLVDRLIRGTRHFAKIQYAR